MFNTFFEVLINTVTITGFVVIMLLIIEYFNIRTRGNALAKLKNKKFYQILFSSLMGFLPGCTGAFVIVSLYTHNIVSFGALVAAMISTFGDETFILLTLMPAKATLIMLILFAIGFIAGLLIDTIKKTDEKDNEHFKLHYHEEKSCLIDEDKKTNSIRQNLKNISFHRALLLFSIFLFILLLLFNIFGHGHSHIEPAHLHNEAHHFDFLVIEDWMQFTFVLLSLVTVYLILKVSEHFLIEHFWEHVIKKHFFRIFLWIFVSLFVIKIILNYIAIDEYVLKTEYYWALVVISVLIGLIPQSGPHLIFITLYAQNLLPLSILLTNSIMQEGHAALPLFAESKRSFLYVKAIKIVVALLVALLGFIFSF